MKPTEYERRAQRDSLARSERGVWGVRRSTPQLDDDPPWSYEMMSDAARLQLGLM